MIAPGWTPIAAQLDGRDTRHVARVGSGIPLLLVHGIGPGTTGPANFAPLIDALPGNWPLHMIDLAGFGGSAGAAPVSPFDATLWLRQICAALDRIGEPVLLVGNSIGGALSLKTAASGVLLHAVVSVGAPAARMAPSDALRAFWTPPASPEALAESIRPMTAHAAPPDAAMVAARWQAFADPQVAGRFAAGLVETEALLSQVVLTPAEANAVRAPVHILHGRQDRACPPSVALALLDLLPQADMTLFGACGHNVLSERTAEVVGLLTAIRDGKRGR